MPRLSAHARTTAASTGIGGHYQEGPTLDASTPAARRPGRPRRFRVQADGADVVHTEKGIL